MAQRRRRGKVVVECDLPWGYTVLDLRQLVEEAMHLRTDGLGQPGQVIMDNLKVTRTYRRRTPA